MIFCRFFTVYGPWGRPDMAYFSFTRNIMEGQVDFLYKSIYLYLNPHENDYLLCVACTLLVPFYIRTVCLSYLHKRYSPPI